MTDISNFPFPSSLQNTETRYFVLCSDTYYWVYLSSDHLFQAYYKKRQVLQNATILLQSAIGITKWGDYYGKVRQNKPSEIEHLNNST